MTEERIGDSFNIELAGVCIGIKPRHERMRDFCKKYISEDSPAFTIEVGESDIEDEREKGIAYIGRGDIPPFQLEKLFIYREIAERLPEYDTFLIHAAAISVDGEGYLFSGPSGTGKTTHIKLWKKEFKDRMRVINDDKPLIRIGSDEVMACGSPWCGKESWSNNISSPLKAVICLHQAKENRIEEMERTSAWESLMNQIYRSRDAANMQRTLGFIDYIISEIPVYSMGCTKDSEAVSVAYEALKGRR
ncbi:MAG: hypothetical protein IKE52_00985 [Mogibacterium sp.]|nr:hypothetical protein [Mogibacterium sp.]